MTAAGTDAWYPNQIVREFGQWLVRSYLPGRECRVTVTTTEMHWVIEVRRAESPGNVALRVIESSPLAALIELDRLLKGAALSA